MFQRTPQTDRPHDPRTRRRAATASMAAVVALLGAACGSDDEETTTADTSAERTESTESTETELTEPEPAEASAAEGFEFTSADGDYAVTFPSEPTDTPTPLQLPGGKTIEIPLQVTSVATSEYTTGAITYPDDVPVADDTDQALDGAVDGAVANVQGAELGESEDIEVDGLPGRRFDFSITQGDAEGRGEAVFVLDGQVLFQAIAVGEIDDADAHGDFLDSFEIL